MALDLEQQYNEEGGKLNARIVAALAKKATDEIQAMGSPFDIDKVRFAKHILDSESPNVRFVARALISQGITSQTDDSVLQIAIDNNFDIFIQMFIEEVGGE